MKKPNRFALAACALGVTIFAIASWRMVDHKNNQKTGAEFFPSDFATERVIAKTDIPSTKAPPSFISEKPEELDFAAPPAWKDPGTLSVHIVGTRISHITKISPDGRIY